MPLKLSIERLKFLLTYDEDSGLFFWNNDMSIKCKSGMQAGNISKSTGYVQLMIDRKNYAAHRLAWFYVNGEWPTNQIDHINGVRNDNKFKNLRQATNKFNSENRRKIHLNKKSCEYLGVHFYSHKFRNKPWQAEVRCGNKRIYLGYYATPEEAYKKYVEAKRQYHEGCTI